MKRLRLVIGGLAVRAETRGGVAPEFRGSGRVIDPFLRGRPGGEEAAMLLSVEGAARIGRLRRVDTLFAVSRRVSGRQASDWRIARRGGLTAVEGFRGERYRALMEPDFSSGSVLLADSGNGPGRWRVGQLVHGPLQVLLICRLARERAGILLHACGVRHGGGGVLFVGATRSGKSTMARLWHAAGIPVLNDDRIVVRRGPEGFSIHGTPWHGDFAEYPGTIASSAPLRAVVFIRHGRANALSPVAAGAAFRLLYPNTFPVLWDRDDVGFTVDFVRALAGSVPCRVLDFVPDRSAVDYFRSRCGDEGHLL